MAQMQDFIRGNRVLARWAGGLSYQTLRSAAAQPESDLHLTTHEYAPALAPRPQRFGLRLGERKLMVALADWLVIIGGLAAIALSSERAYEPFTVLVTLTLVTAFWFFFSSAFDAYSVLVLQSPFRSIYNTVQASLVTGVVYTLLALFTGGVLPVVRFRLSELMLMLLVVVPLALVRGGWALFLSHAPLRRHVAVVGANRSGAEMLVALTRYGGTSYKFLGFFDDHPAPDFGAREAEPAPVYPATDLLAINDLVGIGQIIVANPVQNESLLRTLSICHERGIQITPMFALYQDLTGRVPVGHVGQDWYVALPAHVKSTTRTYMFIKRGYDILFALLGLIFAAPLIPLIALAIKLDSPGPIFFRQTRTGLGGKLFKITKFRSMYQDAEALLGAVWAERGDPRITRVGRLLRRSRLDELPQLWNVLVGDMSFVGPRPERPEFEERLDREIPFYRARRAVRPGLTGWAQVRQGYGNTLLDTLRKVEYDLYYIKNESLYLDLLILIRTIGVVIGLRGT